MKVSQKLIYGFLSVSLLTFVVGTVGIDTIKKFKGGFDYLQKTSMKTIEAGNLIDSNMLNLNIHLTRFLINPKENDDKVVESLLNNLTIAFSLYQEAYETAKSSNDPNSIKMKGFIERFSEYKKSLNSTINEIKILNNRKISEKVKKQKLKELLKLHIKGETIIKDLNEFEVMSGHQKVEGIDKAISLRILISNIITVASVLFALIIGIIISRKISRSLIKLRDSTIEISKGNLYTRVEIETKDEIGQLAASFNKMTEDLQKTTVSRNYVDSIFNSMNSMLIIISPQGIIQTVNPNTCSTLGYQCSELIGMKFDLVIDIKDLLSTAAWIRYLIKKERLNNVERSYITKDGKKISVLFSSSVILDDKRNVQYIICVAQDISLRKIVEEQLNKAQKYSQGIINSSMDMIIAVDTERKITEFNLAAQNVFGYQLEEVLGKTPLMLVYDEQAGNNVFQVLAEKGEFYGEITHKRKNGEPFIAAISITSLKDIDYNFIGFVGILRDITEKNRLERELLKYRDSLEKMVADRTSELMNANVKIKDSLREKEVLLREIHHRVKNNLQIVSSLLESQSRYIEDNNILAKFKDSQNRISSMALIHEKLYQSTSLSKINFAEYIKDLANNLFATYYINATNITLKVTSDEILLNIETAIPCGLIINEIITNSLKYAFPDNRKGEIIINFYCKEDNNLSLIIGDNGIGLPKDIDFTKTKSLGLSLINNLAKRQLDGLCEIVNNKGVVYMITFRELQYKERV
ncbi:MAG: PAS domain S-box protein [Nitrospirae bacterium]|nr:PAS domain S-box protein [Nitrospirota bacterium]